MVSMTVLFTSMFIRCDDVFVGDWDEMKWLTDVKTASDGYVEVPAEGGTYVFTCKNYSGFWLSDATEVVGTSKQIYYPREGGNDVFNIETSWATISSADAKLTVSIEPNTTANSRQLNVVVTAGDIFDYFNFRQAASSN